MTHNLRPALEKINVVQEYFVVKSGIEPSVHRIKQSP